MRIGIVAILAAVTAFLTPAVAPAQSDCADWNSRGFFETAGAADVRACLRAGADLHARNEYGHTPLHIAARKGHAAALAALLEAGADPDARDEDGSTPFDLIPEELIGTPVHRRLSDVHRRLNDARRK